MNVLITDSQFPNLENEKVVFAEAGVKVLIADAHTPPEVMAMAAGADALLVHWAPITREVIASLRQCRVIVRYGIGFDNIDAIAAAEYGIPVCNVPDYASGEVADHTIALALALNRQLPLLDQRVRAGTWKIVPDYPMPSCRDARFVMLGFGRIAREVAKRALSFGFQAGAHDPFVPEAAMQQAGVIKLGLEEALATADILSLHLPLTEETKHVINAAALKRMKKTAIVINTSRGGLVEAAALARALHAGEILAAGLDVYAPEPLASDSPLRNAPRTLLTSHIAWYSDASAPRLQTMAAQEIVRGLRGEPLRSQVNFQLCLDSIKKRS